MILSGKMRYDACALSDARHPFALIVNRDIGHGLLPLRAPS